MSSSRAALEMEPQRWIASSKATLPGPKAPSGSKSMRSLSFAMAVDCSTLFLRPLQGDVPSRRSGKDMVEGNAFHQGEDRGTNGQSQPLDRVPGDAGQKE